MDALNDKVALVTGSSRGIGAAIARLFAAQGAQVVVNARTPGPIESTVSAIQASGGQALGIAADCTDAAAVEQMRARVEAELGPVDILVANVGGPVGDPVPTAELSEEGWRLTLDLNLTATFFTVRSVLPGMVERRRGSIITVSSTAGRQPSQATAAYSAAKAAVVMFTRHLANEVGQHDVRANCIAPGAILTEGGALSRAPEAVQRQVAELHPLKRVGEPDDVAQAALFLASDASSWITGITLDVAGGRVML
jgi:3-oxoacyl-[acyl-carrier protein] reductase